MEAQVSSFASCARHSLVASLQPHYVHVGDAMKPHQLPIVYHERYNITFLGLEKLHPFDSCKFRKVQQALCKSKIISHQQLMKPKEAPHSLLADVHSEKYLKDIHNSNFTIAKVTELPSLFMLPTFMLRSAVVTPMKYHVGGTILAAGLAIERGWAINLGGGMHHAHHAGGGGWCPFDDIMLAIRYVRTASGGAIQKVLYVDVDAHQGNGVERDKLHFQDTDTLILDVYNAGVYPMDTEAKAAIDIHVPLNSWTGDEEYLSKLEAALTAVDARGFAPDLLVLNAGTDVLVGDPLGRLKVSHEAVIQRDEMVWTWALQHSVPIVMTLSGGYTAKSAETIVASITNLFSKFNLGVVQQTEQSEQSA